MHAKVASPAAGVSRGNYNPTNERWWRGSGRWDRLISGLSIRADARWDDKKGHRGRTLIRCLRGGFWAQLLDCTWLRITAANSSKVHLQRICQTARTNRPDARQRKTNGVHRPASTSPGLFQKTIPSHVRKGRTSNAKQHLWLELSIRRSEIKVLSQTVEALFSLSLLEDSWTQNSHQGFVPESFVPLCKQTPADGARFLPKQKLPRCWELWGQYWASSHRKKRKKKYRTENNRTK